MSLATYKKKRSFAATPEPTGGKPTGDGLRFVVQKHAASHLHYDFRLEMGGVLKSWAIPKGPSTDPAVKRLAMMVEDHPYDYRDFEGIIPEGNYGAGTVIVWDEGIYEPLEQVEGRKGQEKLLLKELKDGSLKFRLFGNKLKGEFALVHTHGRGENGWLLIKHRDAYASEADVTKQDKSVVSGKTLEKVAKTSTNLYGVERTEVAVKGNTAVGRKKVGERADKLVMSEEEDMKRPVTAKRAVVTTKNAGVVKQATPVKKRATAGKKKAGEAMGRKAPFPFGVMPMLATLVEEPFDEPGWLYEIKWDGYRALALLNKGRADLISRNQKSFNDKFYPVYEAVKGWGIDAVVDGEVVVLDDKGVSRFGLLQNWRSEADGALMYYVFDLLWLNGRDLTGVSIQDRRSLLRGLVPAEGVIRMSDDFETSATRFFATAQQMGLEGIIAKRVDSLYYPGARSKEWVKMKTHQRHEVVIGGFTRNEGTAKSFSSLLVGVFENNRLVYTGKIGTGFSMKVQVAMMQRFVPLITDKSPFTEVPDVNKPSRFRPDPPHAKATWLKPQLVCEVSYTEITDDGLMRHPSFEGMREDKKAKDVVRELSVPMEIVSEQEVVAKGIVEKKAGLKEGAVKKGVVVKKGVQQVVAAGQSMLVVPPAKGGRKTLLNPTEELQVRKIDGEELSFSHLSKLYWPKDKVTKRDMLNYYYQVAPYILPYLLDRPQSMNRFPNGVAGAGFYQKDVTGKVPGWVEQFPYVRNDAEEKRNFMVCTNEAGLLYMANLGCIEMNPWSSRVQAPDNPDWCLIDLDPDHTNTFEQVIQTAQVVKDVLESVGVKGYCKTSGSTGMHIYIPLQAKYGYDESQLFAKWVATAVQEQLPGFTSIERMTNKRKGKLYVDYLQNRPQATLAAPYSLRPKAGATVSMPLYWEEVKRGLKMKDFTIGNALDRIKSEGDLFKPVLGKGIDLHKVLKKMEGA